jgi:hypothetical protein
MRLQAGVFNADLGISRHTKKKTGGTAKLLDKEIIKIVVEQITDDYIFGHTLVHSDLLFMLGLKEKGKDYYAEMRRVSRGCLECGKMLESIHGIGYRVSYPDDYGSHAVREFKRGARRLTKGQKILDYAPVKHMSEIGLVEYRRVRDRAVELQAHFEGAIVEMKLLQKPHPLLAGLTRAEGQLLDMKVKPPPSHSNSLGAGCGKLQPVAVVYDANK